MARRGSPDTLPRRHRRRYRRCPDRIIAAMAPAPCTAWPQAIAHHQFHPAASLTVPPASPCRWPHPAAGPDHARYWRP